MSTAAYRALHREEAAARTRAWYAKHREEAAARDAAYYAANQERLVAYAATYRATHREKRAAYDAAYHTAHREDKATYLAAYRTAHPEAYRAYDALRRARKLGNSVGLPKPDYKAILDEFGMVCHICGLEILTEAELHMDHVIPLAKGGPHTATNIRPSHAVCNQKKGTMLLEVKAVQHE